MFFRACIVTDGEVEWEKVECVAEGAVLRSGEGGEFNFRFF